MSSNRENMRRTASSSTTLENKAELFEYAIENINDSIYWIRKDGSFYFVNNAACNLLGFTRTEILNKTLFDIDPNVSPEDWMGYFEEIKRGKHIRLESQNISKSGDIIDIEVSATYLKVDDFEVECAVIRDITERKRMERDLEYHATHDWLTNLLNRREFERQLSTLISNTNQRYHALLFIDLDQFNVINDTCGHVAGDQLLKDISHLLNKTLKKSDIIARVGGDEFGVLLKKCEKNTVSQIAQKILDALQNFSFSWEEHYFRLSACIGLLCIDSTVGSVSEALKRVDQACNIAKEQGRNRYHLYIDDDKTNDHKGKLQWVSRLHKAIENESFCLFAQEIRPTSQMGKSSYEFLVRLDDVNDQLIMPGEFIPAAERYQLMPKIDKCIIDLAFSVIQRYASFVESIDHISINISGQTFSDELICDYILTKLNQYDILPGKICFEITETSAVSNLVNAKTFIDRFRKAGCLFALDDFGRGFSSFAYLKNLDVDFLKIDGLFVKDIIENEVDFEMVKAINQIGHALGKKTIAEYVENAQIQDKLHSIGVDYVQGYGVDKPTQLSKAFNVN